jgi:hypothetical protein
MTGNYNKATMTSANADNESTFPTHSQISANRSATFPGCCSGGTQFGVAMIALGFEAAVLQDPPEPVTPEMSPEALARLIS